MGLHAPHKTIVFAENWFRCGRFVGLQRGLRLDLHACGGAGAPCVLQRASLMVRRSRHSMYFAEGGDDLRKLPLHLRKTELERLRPAGKGLHQSVRRRRDWP